MALKLRVLLARFLAQRLQQLASRLMQYGGAPSAAPNHESEKSLVQTTAALPQTLRETALADWFARVRKGAPRLLLPESQGGTPTMLGTIAPFPEPSREQEPGFAPGPVQSGGELENASSEKKGMSRLGEVFFQDLQRDALEYGILGSEQFRLKEPGRAQKLGDAVPGTEMERVTPASLASSGEDSTEITQRTKARAEQSDNDRTIRKSDGKPSDQSGSFSAKQPSDSRSPDPPVTMRQPPPPAFEWSLQPMSRSSLKHDDSKETSFVSNRSPVQPAVPEFVVRDVSRLSVAPHAMAQIESSESPHRKESSAEVTRVDEPSRWPELPEETAPDLRHTVAAVLRDRRRRRDADIEQRGTWNA